MPLPRWKGVNNTSKSLKTGIKRTTDERCLQGLDLIKPYASEALITTPDATG